MNSKKYLRIKF